MKHPTNRAERKRLAEAKALANPLFRQRKINAKKRKIKLTLEQEEAEDELANYRSGRKPRKHVGLAVPIDDDRLDV